MRLVQHHRTYEPSKPHSLTTTLCDMECSILGVLSVPFNGMAEAFVKTIKRDYVYLDDLPDAQTVMQKLPDWIADYNRCHPHSSLNMMSPWEFRSLKLAS